MISTPGRVTTLPDGRRMNCRELLLEALRLDPKLAQAYTNLGFNVSRTEKIFLHDGRMMNKKQLYVEALRWDPGHWSAYYNLVGFCGAKGTVKLSDDRRLNRGQLLLHALHYNLISDQQPAMASQILVKLSASLSADETLTLLDGRCLSKLQLLLAAIRLDRNRGSAFDNIFPLMHKVDYVSVHLFDGRVLNKKEICLEALRCDPALHHMYNNLGIALSSPQATIRLPDGRVMNQRQLYLEALQYAPDEDTALLNLSMTMNMSETVLLNGRRYGKIDLLKRVLTINPHEPSARMQLQMLAMFAKSK
eukprot:m.99728 g.99728  ORF g.99728 m.99728 type:complete len:306 (+) comp14042_c0_seq2:722-1639(+)